MLLSAVTFPTRVHAESTPRDRSQKAERPSGRGASAWVRRRRFAVLPYSSARLGARPLLSARSPRFPLRSSLSPRGGGENSGTMRAPAAGPCVLRPWRHEPRRRHECTTRLCRLPSALAVSKTGATRLSSSVLGHFLARTSRSVKPLHCTPTQGSKQSLFDDASAGLSSETVNVVRSCTHACMHACSHFGPSETCHECGAPWAGVHLPRMGWEVALRGGRDKERESASLETLRQSDNVRQYGSP